MNFGLIVLGIIAILSASVVVLVLYYGLKPDVDAGHHAGSKAVEYWTARAAKLEAKRAALVSAAGPAGDAAITTGDADAEKERKRQEALARRAARAAKSTGGE